MNGPMKPEPTIEATMPHLSLIHISGQSFGLGLAIVKVVMEAHEEAYGVENVENGVLFWFQLALADLGEEEYPELESFERPQTADSEG